MKRKIWYPWGLCWITVVLIGFLSGACGKSEQSVPSPPIAVTPAGEWRTWNFDQAPVDQLPSGVSVRQTGSGTLPKWEVLADLTAASPPNVLAQRSQTNSGERFNLAVIEDSDYQDLELEVRFKAVEGSEDRGGGLIWRYQDPDNYYIARANPLEDNFRIYRVVRGVRRQLASSYFKVTSEVWHSMRIVAQGDQMECFYDGKKYLTVRDPTFRHGKIGLWTKSDAVTYFDDLRVRPIK
ncbi:MAG: DUF1080 domain-containing protein [candidate division NC10 bacterium]|nr:DUF1080 domain-containing protein [candidate division NC10 bacterium]MDE2322234.1 DUF1080 domain-containing protein [candidate division NC10 bacterium]MDE2485217.1 DUF1080 domain-containing protein [candidate division NC10 bacterium]